MHTVQAKFRLRKDQPKLPRFRWVRPRIRVEVDVINEFWAQKYWQSSSRHQLWKSGLAWRHYYWKLICDISGGSGRENTGKLNRGEGACAEIWRK